MALTYCALLPHSKFFLEPETAEAKKVAQTISALSAVKKELSAKKVDTIVMVNANPVAPLDPYSPPIAAPDIYAYYGLDKLITGPIPGISAETRVFNNDLDLMRQLESRAKPLGLKVRSVPQIKMDGPTSIVADAAIPDDAELKLSMIHLPYKDLPSLVDFGSLLGTLFNAEKKNIALIAIGNLSARLTKDSPAGYKPEGALFDQKVQEAAKKNDFSEILKMEPGKLEAAGQEAALPLAILVAANQSNAQAKLISYQADLGVGYGVISWAQ